MRRKWILGLLVPCALVVSLAVALAQRGTARTALGLLGLDARIDEAGPSTIPGLVHEVRATRLADGRYRIEARSEADLYRVQGYLQARDRMFQMDLFRRMGRGRLAALVGDVPFGDGTALQNDAFHRFLGFERDAELLWSAMDAEERGLLEAFSEGVNHWIRTGAPALEHRLLGATVEPWRPTDTLVVYRTLMFGLNHNYSRELRRLAVACALGIDAAERLWPSRVEFGPVFLPDADVPSTVYDVAPAIAPALRERLPGLCADARARETRHGAASTARPRRGAIDLTALGPAARLLREGMLASNNWVVSGARTRSGRPILANDPHIPLMNPPLAWGVWQVLPDREIVGFTFAGIHLVVFGQNDGVAWGGTTNTVDTQDLYVEAALPPSPELPGGGVLYDGRAVPFDVREESFEVRGGEPLVRTVRFTRHGPVLGDLDPFLEGRIPVTTLRIVPLDGARDAAALRAAGAARDADAFHDGIQGFAAGCVSWVFADRAGRIGYTSPCRLPRRSGWSGAFPAPGWLSAYEWQGFVEPSELPRSRDPARGWLATANNQALPMDRVPTTYNVDTAPPTRFLRIASRLEDTHGVTVREMAELQNDAVDGDWPLARAAIAPLCDAAPLADARTEHARALLCSWDGRMDGASAGGSIFVLFTHALLDLSFTDELSSAELWRFVQRTPHFEANVAWTWRRGEHDPLFDDVRTGPVETRRDWLAPALEAAARSARTRWSDDPADWRWGDVRPLRIRHPFGGANPVLSRLLDVPALPGIGGVETVFKSHFLRSDRERMEVIVGPIFRMVIDLGAPEESGFALAGGQSGRWTDDHYADLAEDWRAGRLRPLLPAAPSPGQPIRFVPAAH